MDPVAFALHWGEPEPPFWDPHAIRDDAQFPIEMRR